MSYSRIDLIVNSVLDVDPFGDAIGLPKFERFKKILKDEYNLNFSDNIDWDSTAALPGTYQEFFYTTYTIL